MHRAAIDAALIELDKDSNAPEGVEPHVWERMCRYRRKKVRGRLTLCKKYISYILSFKGQVNNRKLIHDQNQRVNRFIEKEMFNKTRPCEQNRRNRAQEEIFCY